MGVGIDFFSAAVLNCFIAKSSEVDIAASLEHRLLGNEAIQNQDYNQARDEYTKGILLNPKDFLLLLITLLWLTSKTWQTPLINLEDGL
ncbi:5702_t:CDS:2 [Ambispora gerdemannii]|uniref:5702_t:CDS:1 n=1 Tax=Ambispora gerdemannii TaxID=144530 RepID=A0A9N8YQ16_9GLOM|nr:5702_t:CDS:2 [Ambispora gerdemannii]